MNKIKKPALKFPLNPAEFSSIWLRSNLVLDYAAFLIRTVNRHHVYGSGEFIYAKNPFEVTKLPSAGEAAIALWKESNAGHGDITDERLKEHWIAIHKALVDDFLDQMMEVID